jgi:hypothetical protein
VTYTIRLSENFRRVYRKKEARMKTAIDECITRLPENPKHPGLHTHKMQGVKGVWEAYVDDANRVTFHYEGSVIVMRNNHDILKRSP